MKVPPLVSIIINNHNYGRFLGEAIESALAQRHTPLEVVVVDDGSTDESRSIIAGYRDRVVPVLKPCGGQASAFNAGYRASKGSVVIFLDSDDTLLPDAASTAAELLRDPGVAKAHWQLREIDGTGTPTGNFQPVGDLPDGDVRDLTIRNGPTACVTPPTSANAWSREFLEKVMPVPEVEFRINSDGYLVTLGWIYGRVRAASTPQGCYRVHGGNRFASLTFEEKMKRQDEMFLHRCDVLEVHLKRAGVHSPRSYWLIRNLPWVESRRRARAQLGEMIEVGARLILVDEDAWKEAGGEPFLEGREVLPFLERNGVYAGRPPDGATARAELERLFREGAGYIVFPWFSFWWLDEYGEMYDLLRGCDRVLENDLMLVFSSSGD